MSPFSGYNVNAHQKRCYTGVNHFLHLSFYCPVLVELYSPVKFQLIELSHEDIKMMFMCALLHLGDFDRTYICTSAWLYLTFFIVNIVFIVLSFQFKVDRLQIILIAKKYISTCRNCSSVGCLICVEFHN